MATYPNDIIDDYLRKLAAAERERDQARVQVKSLRDACKNARGVLAMQGNGHGPTWKTLDDALRQTEPTESEVVSGS